MRAPESWPRAWPRVDADTEAVAPALNASVQNRDDVVGTIYGPDDKPLHTVVKPRRAFGYHKDDPR